MGRLSYGLLSFGMYRGLSDCREVGRQIWPAAGAFICGGDFCAFLSRNGIPVGDISFPLQAITEAAQFKLEVAVAGAEFQNDWDFWVYPEKLVESSGEVYYTTTLDDKARDILNNGGKLFLNVAGKSGKR